MGLQEDEENVSQILKFVSGVSSLNAILLVLNGAVARVGNKTNYVLQRLYGLCPEVFQEHFYLVFTNTQLEANFEFSTLSIPIKKENVFPIDNLAFSPGGRNYDNLSVFQKKKIETNYNECKSYLSFVFDAWSRVPSKSTLEFAQLRDSRCTLQILIKCVLESIKSISISKIKIEEVRNCLNDIDQKIDWLKKKSILTTETVSYERTPTEYHNTHCLRCNTLCHENCYLRLTLSVGVDIFKDCACMNDGKCRDCKHSYSDHGHVKFKIVEKKTIHSVLSEEERKDLEQSSTTSTTKQDALNKLTQKQDQMEIMLNEYQDEIKIHLVRLKKICPFFDYQLELSFAIAMLKEEVLIVKDEQKREGIEQTIFFFQQLLQNFSEVMDVTVLKQWVNDYETIEASQSIFTFHKSYCPDRSCEEALESISVQFDINFYQVLQKSITFVKYLDNPWTDLLTHDEKLAISIYTSELGPQFPQEQNFYYKLNAYLRQRGSGQMEPLWKPYIFYLTSALKKLPNVKGTFYRVIKEVFSQNFITEFPQNKKVLWTGFTSCSKDAKSICNLIEKEKNCVIFEITIKNGKDISEFSWFPEEHEVLLSCETQFLVTSEPYRRDGQWFINLQEVDF